MLLSLLALLAMSDVQGLIDRARPGDRVVVPEGVHRGPFVISKPLTLVGEGGGVLDGGGSGTILTVRSAR
ncbi:MAG TPA: hypothetical protein VFC86_13870, partial [Planctomycetota bacterium]|nr:hypothetical protein [Planctomycetota bacterium]